MDTKIIRYVIEIAKAGSLAKASEKLYVSPSALNQMLGHLESDLGAPIFTRERNHWQLTEMGQVFVSKGTEILQLEKDTIHQIHDMAKMWNDTVRIGLPPERGIVMFISIYPELHKKYPKTTFQPVEVTVTEQVKMLLDHSLDFGFQTVTSRSYQRLVYSHILNEPFLLGIPAQHRLAYDPETIQVDKYPSIPLQEFKDDLFTLVRNTSTMRPAVDNLFKAAGFKPKLLFNSTSMHAMQALTAQGECCCIIPQFYAVPNKNICFYMTDPSMEWELCEVHAADHYLSQPAHSFIAAARDYWRKNRYLTLYSQFT